MRETKTDSWIRYRFGLSKNERGGLLNLFLVFVCPAKLDYTCRRNKIFDKTIVERYIISKDTKETVPYSTYPGEVRNGLFLSTKRKQSIYLL